MDNTEKKSEQDFILITAFLAGDNTAFDKLVLNYQNRIFNTCYRILGDYHEANDSAQDVFVKVFRSLKKFRFQSSFSTWIYRIAVNEAHNHHRWFSRHRKREVGLESEDTAAGKGLGDLLRDPGRSPFELALRDETLELIEDFQVNLTKLRF